MTGDFMRPSNAYVEITPHLTAYHKKKNFAILEQLGRKVLFRFLLRSSNITRTPILIIV